MEIDGLRIPASPMAQNQPPTTQHDLNKNPGKPSPDSKVNSTTEDEAGLITRSLLNAKIGALTQFAQSNIIGVGFLQVTDSALAQVTLHLNRAVALATEASNSLVSDRRRATLQAEYMQINLEINVIGNSSKYNGTSVFSSLARNSVLSDGMSVIHIRIATGLLSAATLGLVAGSVTKLGAPAVAAFATVNLTGAPSDGDSVVIGDTTYIFRYALSTNPTVPNEVLINGSSANAEVNLSVAINFGSIEPYVSAGTKAHTHVGASLTLTGITLTAIATGTGGNGLTLRRTGTKIRVSGATFVGGMDAITVTRNETNILSTMADAQATLGLIKSALSNVEILRRAISANLYRFNMAIEVLTNETQNVTSARDGDGVADITLAAADLSQFIVREPGTSEMAQANLEAQTVKELVQEETK